MQLALKFSSKCSDSLSGLSLPTAYDNCQSHSRAVRLCSEEGTGKMEPLVGLRNVNGVAVPMAQGLAMERPIAGVAAGFGTPQVSHSDSPGRIVNGPSGCSY